MEHLQELWREYLFTPQTGFFSAVVAVLSVIAMWVLFKKAGKSGWRSLVPILNLYTLVDIADGFGIKFLLLPIPVVGVVYHVLLNLRLARAFGKGLLYGVCLIFFTPLFTLFLGLGNARYRGPRGRDA